MSRQRQYSGVGSRSCKSCWLRLRTGKYRSVILIVVIFSAWLSLHFVRAAIEYHQQVAKERVMDMLMEANAYHGNGDDDDDNSFDDVSSTSTESYSTEPWQNPTNFVFRPLFPGSRDISFNKGDNLDSWSSSTSTVGSTKAGLTTRNDRDEEGIGGIRDLATTKPLPPGHVLNEADNDLLKQLHEDTTGSAEETTDPTTEGFTKAGGAGNYFREDKKQATSTSSDFDLEVAMTTDIMIGNTASNDNKNANVMKIVNDQQFIVKPAPVEANNFKVSGDLRADKDEVTQGFTDETTTTFSDITTDFETVTEMSLLGDASNIEISKPQSNEDNLKFVAQADQIINSPNDNIAVHNIENVELPNQEQIPDQAHVVSDQPQFVAVDGMSQQGQVSQQAVNPPVSNTVPQQSQSTSDAQKQMLQQSDDINRIVPNVVEPTGISQQNLNNFPQDQGGVPIVNQQSLADQSNSAQLQYSQQTIPTQKDIRTSGESYVNPSFLHQGYPLPQQQDLNPTLQQVDPTMQVQPYPAGQQPSNQAVQQQNYPANVQQNFNSIQQQNYPGNVQQNYNSIQEPNYPAMQKQNYPAIQQQNYPAIPQQNNPAIQPNYPTIQQPNNPAIQQHNYPVAPQQNSALLQQIYHAGQQQNDPVLPQKKSVLPLESYLDTQQQNSALPQQNYLDTLQQHSALPHQDYLGTQQQNSALPEQNNLATQQQNYQAVPQKNYPAVQHQSNLDIDLLQQKQQPEPSIQHDLNSDRQNQANPTIQKQANMATQRDVIPQTRQGIQQMFRQAVQKHLNEQMPQQ